MPSEVRMHIVSPLSSMVITKTPEYVPRSVRDAEGFDWRVERNVADEIIFAQDDDSDWDARNEAQTEHRSGGKRIPERFGGEQAEQATALTNRASVIYEKSPMLGAHYLRTAQNLVLRIGEAAKQKELLENHPETKGVTVEFDYTKALDNLTKALDDYDGNRDLPRNKKWALPS